MRLYTQYCGVADADLCARGGCVVREIAHLADPDEARRYLEAEVTGGSQVSRDAAYDLADLVCGVIMDHHRDLVDCDEARSLEEGIDYEWYAYRA